jgi:hypothetical protein
MFLLKLKFILIPLVLIYLGNVTHLSCSHHKGEQHTAKCFDTIGINKKNNVVFPVGLSQDFNTVVLSRKFLFNLDQLIFKNIIWLKIPVSSFDSRGPPIILAS